MNVVEQVWLLVGIGGFLIFFEGVITRITKLLVKWTGRSIPEDYPKIIAGLILLGLAMYELAS